MKVNGGGTCPDFGKFCAPAEPKSRPITLAKFFIEKAPKTYENDINLLIFLDLTYDPYKNSKDRDFCRKILPWVRTFDNLKKFPGGMPGGVDAWN